MMRRSAGIGHHHHRVGDPPTHFGNSRGESHGDEDYLRPNASELEGQRRKPADLASSFALVRPPWPRRWRGLSLMMKLVVLSGDVGSLWCCEPVGQTGVGASRVS
jgi:hypothetical protein